MISKKKVILYLIVILFFTNIHFITGLGLTPAIIDMDFQPGLKFLVNFRSIIDDPNISLTVYADGDFKDYVKFDKTRLKGTEGFTAYIDLPNETIKYGPNRLFIRVAEGMGPSPGVSVRLDVGAVILIRVPYPGEYAEISKVDVNNANPGEPVLFSMDIENFGKKELIVDTKAEVYSDKRLIDSFPIEKKVMPSLNRQLFSKLKNKGYDSGYYNTTFIMTYGSEKIVELKASKEFKIGNLSVDIINWTKEFNTSKINEFKIQIESRWNNKLENVYANVVITNSSGYKVDNFNTPSINLEGWGVGDLKGFFNCEKLSPGIYNADITLFYEDRSTSKSVEIKLIEYKKSDKTKIILTIVSIVIGVIILFLIFIIFYLILTRGKKDVKRKEKEISKK